MATKLLYGPCSAKRRAVRPPSPLGAPTGCQGVNLSRGPQRQTNRLRRTLLTQARRLELLASTRLDQVRGDK